MAREVGGTVEAEGPGGRQVGQEGTAGAGRERPAGVAAAREEGVSVEAGGTAEGGGWEVEEGNSEMVEAEKAVAEMAGLEAGEAKEEMGAAEVSGTTEVMGVGGMEEGAQEG